MSFKDYIKEVDDQKDINITDKLIEFFMDNPYPEDSKVHEYAKELGIDPDKVETTIYSILSSFLSEGKFKGKKIDINSELLQKAVDIEKEHTTDDNIALKIVKDHVAEHGWKYYEELIKMEEKLK